MDELRFWAKRNRWIPKNKKGFLIIDNIRAHTLEKDVERASEHNFDIIFLSPNTTSLLLPLDIAVNKPFKQKYQ